MSERFLPSDALAEAWKSSPWWVNQQPNKISFIYSISNPQVSNLSNVNFVALRLPIDSRFSVIKRLTCKNSMSALSSFTLHSSYYLNKKFIALIFLKINLRKWKQKIKDWKMCNEFLEFEMEESRRERCERNFLKGCS